MECLADSYLRSILTKFILIAFTKKLNSCFLISILLKLNTFLYDIFVLNLDQFKLIGTHLIALYVNGNNIIYPDSFRVDPIPKKLKHSYKTKISQQIFTECKHKFP